MRAVELIRKKRNGIELSRDEIRFLIQRYCADQLPDYQMSALLMATFFRGMTEAEVVALTEEMMVSGTVISLDHIPGRKIDKHSTGGVGDKTSLVVAPVVAAAGIIVPMISGRGLAHTGGTLDKLESIPGFSVRLPIETFKRNLQEIGVCLIGQTEDLVPADRRMYALRDVTATVESYPLIVASIMSKKLAEGIDGIVLDVKTGSGAFMKTEEDAEKLAKGMVSIGKAFGKRVVAIVSDMNQPLGECVGNSLEIIEALEVLKGNGPEDLARLCEELAAYCLLLGEAASSLDEGRALFREIIASGRALEKFRKIVGNQHGDPAIVDDYSLLPRSKHSADLLAPEGGVVREMDVEGAGMAACVLGAGRETLDSIIDPAVGIRFRKKIGDTVAPGETLCTIYHNDEGRYREASRRLLESYRFSQEPAQRPTLIKKIIS